MCRLQKHPRVCFLNIEIKIIALTNLMLHECYELHFLEDLVCTNEKKKLHLMEYNRHKFGLVNLNGHMPPYYNILGEHFGDVYLWKPFMQVNLFDGPCILLA